METNNTSGLLGLLSQKMLYDTQKTSMHAENVANVSTPGYKARDIDAFTFGDAMKQAGGNVGMKVTDPHHIVPASMAGVNAKTYVSKTSETLPSGNSVDMEHEMMEVSKTAIDYQAQTSVYKKVMGLFRIALKGQ